MTLMAVEEVLADLIYNDKDDKKTRTPPFEPPACQRPFCFLAFCLTCIDAIM